MTQIPTAENLLRNQFCEGEFDEIMDCLNGSIEPSLVTAMIEFAKLHVEAALIAALNSVEYADGNDSAVDDIDEESILNSYSLDNIK